LRRAKAAVYTGPKDSIPPTTPGAISLNSTDEFSANISWGASSDAVGVTGYEIFVNGSLHSTSNTNSAIVNGLACDQNHKIKVRAYDAFGNKSDFTAEIIAKTSTCPPCVNLPTISGGNGPEAGQTAYLSMTLPTTILAENVDNGTNGVAYFDDGYGGNVNATRPTWSTEHGFRLDSDIEYDEENGNTFIGGINPGEWAEYTVNVPAGGGTYSLSSIKYSTNSGVTGKVWFKIGGFTSCLFDLPNTNKVINSLPVNFEFTLTQGEHVFTWVSEAFGFNLDEFVIVKDEASGIKANTVSNKISVYPNPFNDELIIITNAQNIELFNLVGQALPIETTSVAIGFNINTTNLQPGTYFIKAGYAVKKIIKK
jgi:hypothetical protein